MPTKFELDAASSVNPIFIKHFSGHLFVVNSLALRLIGYNETTPDPEGGEIDRYQNGTLTGVLR